MSAARLMTRVGCLVVVQGCATSCATNGAPTQVPCSVSVVTTGSPSPSAVAASPLVACEAPETAEPPGAEAARIEFDCHSSIDTKRGQSLREWSGGGPFGAAWNIDGASLICSVHLESPCEGTVHIELYGNSRPLGRDTRELEQGPTDWDVDVASELWTDTTTNVGLTYETMVLAVGGVIICNDGTLHHPFADAFIAGFSRGE
jgi:hypothetical protein